MLTVFLDYLTGKVIYQSLCQSGARAAASDMKKPAYSTYRDSEIQPDAWFGVHVHHMITLAGSVLFKVTSTGELVLLV